MKIGFIGVCGTTLDLAARAAKSGHQVLISHTRSNNHMRDVVGMMEGQVKLVSRREAAEAKMLVLFIPREDIQLFLSDLPDMSEKILLHANNPIYSLECLTPSLNLKSSGEIIASLLPEAHIVKIHNIVDAEIPVPQKKTQAGNELFYTGSNKWAKNKVKSFLKTLNFMGIDFDEMYLETKFAYSPN
ncbi:NAD(P)-binding domain-containing protein [Flavobacterium daemonense]|uniref:NAD(P)-binding domain-containing protein n=1 Tax=Flavobacterium daemonense TaxID=1393049 RepID=UPI0011865841|nr:NAD(P)-binding domain-containing protein [Flavobacterium daemonense]KAF2333724.1 NAD(P)-binding domain-containing protein [Flavobacterium daemonense]